MRLQFAETQLDITQAGIVDSDIPATLNPITMGDFLPAHLLNGRWAQVVDGITKIKEYLWNHSQVAELALILPQAIPPALLMPETKKHILSQSHQIEIGSSFPKFAASICLLYGLTGDDIDLPAKQDVLAAYAERLHFDISTTDDRLAGTLNEAMYLQILYPDINIANLFSAEHVQTVRNYFERHNVKDTPHEDILTMLSAVKVLWPQIYSELDVKTLLDGDLISIITTGVNIIGSMWKLMPHLSVLITHDAPLGNSQFWITDHSKSVGITLPPNVIY